MLGVRLGQENLHAAGMTVAEPITLAEGPGTMGECGIIEKAKVSTIWKYLCRGLYIHTQIEQKPKIIKLFKWKWLQKLDD